MAAVCIIEPEKETNWDDQRRRKFRCRRARSGSVRPCTRGVYHFVARAFSAVLM